MALSLEQAKMLIADLVIGNRELEIEKAQLMEVIKKLEKKNEADPNPVSPA